VKPPQQLALDLFGDPVPARPAAPPRPGRDATAPPAVPLDAVLTQTHWVHPRASRQLQLPACVVAYEFKRGKRRTIGLSVGPEGLSVSAPRWTPVGEVEALLRERADWVTAKLRLMQERRAQMEQARIEWRDGVSFPYLGRTVRLHLDATRGTGAVLDEGECVLRVGLPQQASATQIGDAAQAWLMRQARTLFTERLEFFAQALQVRWTKLRLSSAGTRWGSASADGGIRLNWRLIHFGPEVIDYVVAHELSHLRVMDHSPQFWDTVASVMPDYAQRRQTLKKLPVPKW